MRTMRGRPTPTPPWADILWRCCYRAAREFDRDPAKRLVLNAPLLHAERAAAAITGGNANANAATPNMDNEVGDRALRGAMAQLDRANRDCIASSLRAVHSPSQLRHALSEELRATLFFEEPATIGDAGFALVRHLGEQLALADRILFPGQFTPRRPSITTASQPHARPLRAGEFLAADPMAFNFQRRCLENVYAVTPLLMLVVDAPADLDSTGTAIILNAPSKLRLRRHDWMHALDAPVGGVFSANPVLYGGDAELRSLTMLHPHGARMRGARRVLGGLYEGGLVSDAAQLVRSGAASPEDFLFYRGLVEFRTGELEAQAAQGEWIRLESSDALARAVANEPASLATEEGRLDAAWAAWAAAIGTRGDEFGCWLRLRPEVLKEIIVRAAYQVQTLVSRSRPGGLLGAVGDGDDEEDAFLQP